MTLWGEEGLRSSVWPCQPFIACYFRDPVSNPVPCFNDGEIKSKSFQHSWERPSLPHARQGSCPARAFAPVGMSGSSPLLPHAPQATSQPALPCLGSLHPYGHQFPQLESPTPRVPWAAPRSGPSPPSSEPAAFPRQVASGRELSSLPFPSNWCCSLFPCSRIPSPRESGGAD